ncbi:ArsJ-associated glyceraldehyde-3-phosphate dehydrogenase [Jannaschia seohaensis]|uniref:Glyceraldehyde-3-phosphate dehydrogenase n=1 Tax=Jannaschia seohaensis TaxID=475081 RepID=A0A2Y9AFF3_9RHOB|nr:ArsJ-associated glyceraldehyde-3-phosphate dehydrogenase [Jannaschia seohaensis]PWJ20899.1 glyceraldehyde 3-phosphate dehydrogenase [Jannaschia seohaensis]SSA41309.1 glyceraldehyde 3-phosphate dehydrogenase [Jannaschia seohaensis]
MKVYLNGLGRIGKLVLRDLLDRPQGVEIVGVNDAAGDAAQHALLLEFDSVHGRWTRPVRAEGDALIAGETRLPLTAHRRIEDLPLAGVDAVLDCTGVFKTGARLQPYFDAGIPRVVVSAPVKDGDALNLVYGVNHGLYDGSQRLLTAASCTTNCLAPVVAVLRAAFGIRHGSFTTIHDVTNTQTIVDRPHKDPRRARSALSNLIPTTTGSAKAIMQIFPDLEGRLMGHAVRVPLLNASLTDCAFEMAREVTVDEVHAAFRAAEAGEMAGILGVEDRPLVSSDFLNDRRSAIVDAPSTVVIQGTHLKLYVWYDNEFGYAVRMADIVRMLAQKDSA